MRQLSLKIASAGAGLVLLFAPHAAWAAHGKAGLWEITIKMDGQNPNMPDMSKLPPEVRARMKAMGVGANGTGFTVQRCRTPAEAAQDSPPSGAHDKSCTLSNVSYTGGSMTADMTCTGNFTGTGHMHFVWDSDEHYAGEVSMTGTSGGRPMSRTQKIEGRWLSAQCTAAQR
ncbi:MAG: DUF3617 domain-containing protein [Rhizomicrobium sp.]